MILDQPFKLLPFRANGVIFNRIIYLDFYCYGLITTIRNPSIMNRDIKLFQFFNSSNLSVHSHLKLITERKISYSFYGMNFLSETHQRQNS